MVRLGDRRLRLAVNTGMRSGEIIGLKWADVDRRDGEAVLDGFLRIGAESAKGHRTRHVPINSAVKAVLDAERPYAGKDGFSPYVSVNPDTGKPFQLSSVSHAFQRAAGRAGVEGVCFHVTRHTAVSRMVAAGIPDRLNMKIVGHSTPHMMARYSHLAPAALKGATDCLARQKAYTERTNLAPAGGAAVTS
jgi:integrase